MKKTIPITSIFDLYGETLMVYNKETKKFKLYGKISSIYSLGNYKYLYVFYNKNHKSTSNVFVEKAENVLSWLSQGILEIKK